MGVYVIKCKRGPYFKIGHHKISDKRPNVYFRYINRGFHSVKHPEDMDGLLSFGDMELLAWYPTLNTSHEKEIHRIMKKKFANWGEFYHLHKIHYCITIIKNNYNVKSEMPNEEDLRIAKIWAKLAH